MKADCMFVRGTSTTSDYSPTVFPRGVRARFAAGFFAAISIGTISGAAYAFGCL